MQEKKGRSVAFYVGAFLVFIASSGCTLRSSDTVTGVQANYEVVSEQYCKQKYPKAGYDACLNHMWQGYLTNEEINYINEKTRWWRVRNDP